MASPPPFVLFQAEAGLINAEVRLRVHRDDEATLAERRRADELEERLAVVTEEMGVLKGENDPTHFSHMSHPTFPISHLLFLFFCLNTGLNVAESTNFAFADWLRVGAASLARYRTPPTRDTTVLYDALVCTAAQHGTRSER